MNLLDHSVSADGVPAECFGYHNDHAPARFVIPGSPQGSEVILLRTWRSVLEAFRNPRLRNLSVINQDDAVTGITREHSDGLFRRNDSSTRPPFGMSASEQWRPGIRRLAVELADAAEGDLTATFVNPLATGVAALTTGLDPATCHELFSLIDICNGLITCPADHGAVDTARAELYALTAAIVAELPRQAGTVIAEVVALLRAQGMESRRIVPPLAVIFGGYPSLIPVLAVVLFEYLSRPETVRHCHRDPSLVSRIGWELLGYRAHFTFGLPGIALDDVNLGDCLVPSGSIVMPVVHAAQRDPARRADPDQSLHHRDYRTHLVFGAGRYICRGRAITLITLEEALRAITLADIQLAVDPATITWRPGLLPTPQRIPIDRT